MINNLIQSCDHDLSELGPLLVAFGGLLSVGDVIVVCVALQQYMKKVDSNKASLVKVSSAREI